MKTEWSKLRAVDIGARAPLGPAARELLNRNMTAEPYLELLVAHGLLADASRVLAYVLAGRGAIWWGCLCVQRVGVAPLPSSEEAALKAAARWCVAPDEAHRQAAERLVNSAALDTPAGCLAWGVSVTEPRVVFPGTPPVPAQPELLPKAVSAAVQLAAVNMPEARAEFVALGVGILQGRHMWDSIN